MKTLEYVLLAIWILLVGIYAIMCLYWLYCVVDDRISERRLRKVLRWHKLK